MSSEFLKHCFLGVILQNRFEIHPVVNFFPERPYCNQCKKRAGLNVRDASPPNTMVSTELLNLKWIIKAQLKNNTMDIPLVTMPETIVKIHKSLLADQRVKLRELAETADISMNV